jgi:hypothetical protein
VPDHRDAGVAQRSDGLARAVRRALVHDDDLEGDVALPAHPVQGPQEQLRRFRVGMTTVTTGVVCSGASILLTVSLRHAAAGTGAARQPEG